MRRLIALLAIALVAVLSTQSAVAYQVPATPFSQGSGSAVGTMPGSNLTQTISSTGATRISAPTTAGSRGTTPATYSPPLVSSTPSQEITVRTGDCAPVGPCANRGTVTITFSQPVHNPVLHIAGIGGVSSDTAGGHIRRQSELHSIFKLAGPSGVTLSKASTGNNLAVANGNIITASNDDTSPACDSTSTGHGPPARATAACGSVRVNGTVTSLTFTVTAIFTKSSSLPPFNASTSGDGVSIVASVREDFGDAPASYDAGNAARAVMSDIKLGGAVSEDNDSVANGISSPNTSPDSGDDGVTLTPLGTTETSYSAAVAINGASKAGRVCGWIDFDKSGTFAAVERACVNVTAGQTSATLKWTGLSGLTAGSTHARFRIGYSANQVESQIGGSDSGEVEDYPFTIKPPEPPTATPDSESTPQDVDVTVDPLVNDKAGTGATLVPSSVCLMVGGGCVKAHVVPSEGGYAVGSHGTVTFDPLPAFTGKATPITYRVADTSGQTATSTITITVTPVKPDAVDDTNTTPYDTSVTTAVLTNDKPGHPSAPLVPSSVCIVVGSGCVKAHVVPGEGVYTVQPNGSVTLDPMPGFTGAATPVTYRVADDNGATDTATLTITVQPPPPPKANPDSGTTPQNVDVTVNPLTNDSAGAPGVNLDPGSVCIVVGNNCVKAHTVPSEGTYTVKADGSVTFDPVPTFTGGATPVTYQVADSTGQTATSTITITVRPVTPDAVDDSRTTLFNTPVTIAVLQNDKPGSANAPLVPSSVRLVDPQSGTLVTILIVPNEGTYAASPDGTARFTPVNGFTGTATPVAYQVADSNGTPARARITVSVAKPPPLTAIDDAATTPFNTTVTVPVLINDKPGHPSVPLVPSSVCIVVGSTCVKTHTVPDEGTYTVQPNGSIAFDPVDGFREVTTPITYRVADKNGSTDTATLTVTVGDAPDAKPDARTTKQDIPVTVDPLANDKPGAGGSLDPKSVEVFDSQTKTWGKAATVPGEGTYTVHPDGTITFDPLPRFIGQSSIPYRVTDSHGNTAASTVTITVEPIKPQAVDDSATTPFNTPVTVPVVRNDKPGDPSAPLVPSSVMLVDPAIAALAVPGEGTYRVRPDGSIAFTPVDGFRGTTTPVTYRVKDAHGTPTSAKLTITVEPPKGADADPDEATGKPGKPVVIDPLKNDKPSKGAMWRPETVCLITVSGECVKRLVVPHVGTWTLGRDGTIRFVSDPAFRGAAKVTYRVTDTFGVTVDSIARFTITDQPAPPGGDDELPETGGPLALILVAGALLVAIGGTLVAITRRSRNRRLST